MKQLIIDRDPTSIATYLIPLSDDVFSVELVAATDTTLAVPADATLAIFSAELGKDFWVSDAAITLPTGGAFTSQRIYQNRLGAIVVPGSTLHFLSVLTNKMVVEFFN